MFGFKSLWKSGESSRLSSRDSPAHLNIEKFVKSSAQLGMAQLRIHLCIHIVIRIYIYMHAWIYVIYIYIYIYIRVCVCVIICTIRTWYMCAHPQPAAVVFAQVFMSTGSVERGAGVATWWDLWSSQGDRSPTRNLNCCYGRGLQLGIGPCFFLGKRARFERSHSIGDPENMGHNFQGMRNFEHEVLCISSLCVFREILRRKSSKHP